MTELLSLPDDVLGRIVLESLTESSITRLDRQWCRIASTSRRLWKLHLPHTPHPISICNEAHLFNEDGVQWWLRRLRFAKSLAIGVGEKGWSEGRFIRSKQSGLALPCDTFPALQVLGMYFRDYAQELYFQPHFLMVVQGAPNLTALTLHPRTLSTVALLASSSLKHLALHISIEEAWPGPMTFPDVTACPMLESLKVVTDSRDASPDEPDDEFAGWHADAFAGWDDAADSRHQPDVCLSHMHRLQHFQLEEQALLRDKLALPLGCRLFLRLRGCQGGFSWGDCWGSVLHHATVMCLELRDVDAWPGWLSDCRLQLLVLEIMHTFSETERLDLATLKHIPHVRLLSNGPLKLTHTEGSWQSLEVVAEGGVSVQFSNIDAFVACTELFSFCYSYESPATDTARSSAAMMDRVQVTCAASGVECYRTSHRDSGQLGTTWVKRISNRKLKSPYDREEVLLKAGSGPAHLAARKDAAACTLRRLLAAGPLQSPGRHGVLTDAGGL